jgi:SAM-dependent methyltransferase
MDRRLKKLVPAGVRRSVKLRLHAGDRYTCALCGFTSGDLVRIGEDYPVLQELDVVGGGSRLAGCYRCGSTDRERLVFLYLRDETSYLAEPTAVRVLHMAPERQLTRALADAGFAEYVCGDLFTEGYKYPDHVQNINVLSIPFEDDHFDVVICNHILEHVPEDEAAMRELRRVLRPGGLAVLQVPIASRLTETHDDPSVTEPADRERVFGQFDHVRLYGTDYADRLRASGFEVQGFDPPGDYERYGVNLREHLYVCSTS